MSTDCRVTVAGAALERLRTEGRVTAAADVAKKRRITDGGVADTYGVAEEGERSIGRIQKAIGIV